MQELLNMIDFGSIIMMILTGVVTWLGNKINKIYNEKIKNEMVRDAINDCVKYVEQKSKTEKITNKYQLAKTKALNILTSKGIDITDDEIDILIESFVNSLKEGK